MATHADVRRIALALPETSEAEGKFAFFVRNKGKLKQFLWLWQERLDPKKARVPNPKVLALRTASLDDKEFLLAAHPERIFTEPHYNGYPAVLLRLDRVTVRELRPLITEAWRAMAPPGMEPLARPPARARGNVTRKRK
jgi:hypothetical protein